MAHDFREARAEERHEGSTSANAGGSAGVAGAATRHDEETHSAAPSSVSSAAGTGAASNMTPVSEDARQPQDDLRSALKNQIGSDADGIAIAVDATTIRLSGSVPSRDERDKAIEIAQSRAGNRQVDASDLTVK